MEALPTPPQKSEKNVIAQGTQDVESGSYMEGHGDLQVTRLSNADSSLKVAKDGMTILIPQPSDDPADPLNWTWKKKHLVLFSLVFASLVSAFARYPSGAG